MQISLRSALTAGTVAVVGAGALALVPVAPSTTAPMPVVAVPSTTEVALAGVTLPFDIVGLLQNLGVGGPIPGIVDALPALLPNDLVTAVLAEFAAEAGPLLTAAAGEVFGYLGTAVSALLTSIPQRIGEAVVAIPAVLASAVQSISTGDLPTALETLTTGIVAPITAVGQAIQDAGQEFEGFVSGQITALGAQLPGVLFTSIQTVITASFQGVLDAVQGALSGLFGGVLPSAAGLPAAAARRTALPASAAAAVPVILSAPADSAAVDEASPAARVAVTAAASTAAPAEAAEDASTPAAAPSRESRRDVVVKAHRSRATAARPSAAAGAGAPEATGKSAGAPSTSVPRSTAATRGHAGSRAAVAVSE